jgi:DNA-binding response OmpR family regulator
LAEVGILIVDDDIASQRALKHVLDSEGWRVRIVPVASQALAELASGAWNLVIVNVALIDVRGPLYAILKELAQAEMDDASVEEGPSENALEGPVAVSRRQLRVLFLVSSVHAKRVHPVLERDALPYSPKPYHLHDFLEKVSELLVEAGAIAEPIRSIGGLGGGMKVRRVKRVGRDSRRGTMFASREDYQMTEEEMAEFERQEEEERKKREKEQREREHR